MNNINFAGKNEIYKDSDKSTTPPVQTYISGNQIQTLQAQIRRFKDLTKIFSESSIPKLNASSTTNLPNTTSAQSTHTTHSQPYPNRTNNAGAPSMKKDMPMPSHQQPNGQQSSSKDYSNPSYMNPPSSSSASHYPPTSAPSATTAVSNTPSIPKQPTQPPAAVSDWRPISTVYYTGPKQQTEGMIAAAPASVSISGSNTVSINSCYSACCMSPWLSC